jgi:mannosyltransferase OCH1-like enzyme
MQTWKTEHIPEQWVPGQQSLLKHLPADFTYVYLTDAAMFTFVKFAFPEFVDSFALMPHPIQRADILRYLWLYAFGGIYLDLDYLVLRPWTHYIEHLNAPLMVLYSANVDRVLTNSMIVAKPGVPMFLNLARDALSKHKTSFWSISKHVEVMVTTGPLAFDHAVRNCKMPYAILPKKLFLLESPMIGDGAVEADGYMKALEGGSWNSGDSLILNFLNKYKFFVVAALVLIIVYKLIDGSLAHVILKVVMKRMRKYKKDL